MIVPWKAVVEPARRSTRHGSSLSKALLNVAGTATRSVPDASAILAIRIRILKKANNSAWANSRSRGVVGKIVGHAGEFVVADRCP
jgi:hypothetical protein